MFSAMTFWPTCGQADSTYSLSCAGGFCVVASAGGRRSSSTVTSLLSLSTRGALSILTASNKFARASFLVSGKPWSTVPSEQRACEGILCLLRSDWSLRWLDVCICTDASETGFAFAVCEGCHELASEVGRVSQRTRFPSSSRSIGARSRALRFIALVVDWKVQVRTRTRGRLHNRNFAQTSLGCLCNLDPSKWRLAEYGGFFRDENIKVLEARSMLYAVRYAESCYPRGRFLILSDNFALALALCKGRSVFYCFH